MSWIVVTGLPASGKSALARSLAESLGRPLLDKDDFLEALFVAEGTVDTERRSVLSRQADERFARAASERPDAVLVSFWRRDELSPTAGTPTEWLRSQAGTVEVHCRCSVDIAVTRFVTRTRHEAHGDLRRTAEQLTTQFNALAALGPLGFDLVVEVDTESVVDIDALVRAIESRRT